MLDARTTSFGMALALAFGAVAAAAAPSRIGVEARVKTGKARAYPTRILRHLTDFAPGEPVRRSPYGGWLGPRHKAKGFWVRIFSRVPVINFQPHFSKRTRPAITRLELQLRLESK